MSYRQEIKEGTDMSVWTEFDYGKRTHSIVREHILWKRTHSIVRRALI